MHAVHRRVSVATFAATLVLSFSGTEAADAEPAAAQAAPSQRVPGNGGVRPVNPPASAVSAVRGRSDVQTTTSDGRKETRGAPDRHETTDATTPNDP